jgi:LSD1 subclass zinc finger protein
MSSHPETWTRAVPHIDAPSCPKCGAPLDVRGGSTEVRCSYCGALANVRERERFSTPTPSAPPQRSASAIVIVSLMAAAVGAGGFATSRSMRASARVLADVSRFDDPPMLADVNGDGVPDVIGHMDDVVIDAHGSVSTDALVAFEGATGKPLWKVPMPADSFHGEQAIVGDLFITVDQLGKVQASHIADGSPAWAGRLSDKAEHFCKDASAVIIEASDGMFTRFELATGKKSAADAPKKGACAPVYETQNTTTPRYSAMRTPMLGRSLDIPGMYANRQLVPTSRGVTFMLGSRDKGTRVAMVAAVDSGKVLWSSVVPAVDPLTTAVSVKMMAASDGDRVVVPYALTDGKGVRMACFDARTGERRWDVQVHQHDVRDVERGVTIEAGRVYYSSWSALYALSVADGKPLYRVGSRE